MAKKKSRSSSIILKLEGYDELITKIEKAGGSIDSTVTRALTESAKVMHSYLEQELKDATESDLAKRMPQPEIIKDGNKISARVGFEKGTYNPKKLTDGYKALFLNYGTPHRKKHGIEEARGFIWKAKKAAKSKIRKKEKETLDEILKELE